MNHQEGSSNAFIGRYAMVNTNNELMPTANRERNIYLLGAYSGCDCPLAGHR